MRRDQIADLSCKALNNLDFLSENELALNLSAFSSAPTTHRVRSHNQSQVDSDSTIDSNQDERKQPQTDQKEDSDRQNLNTQAIASSASGVNWDQQGPSEMIFLDQSQQQSEYASGNDSDPNSFQHCIQSEASHNQNPIQNQNTAVQSDTLQYPADGQEKQPFQYLDSDNDVAMTQRTSSPSQSQHQAPRSKGIPRANPILGALGVSREESGVERNPTCEFYPPSSKPQGSKKKKRRKSKSQNKVRSAKSREKRRQQLLRLQSDGSTERAMPISSQSQSRLSQQSHVSTNRKKNRLRASRRRNTEFEDDEDEIEEDTRRPGVHPSFRGAIEPRKHPFSQATNRPIDPKDISDLDLIPKNDRKLYRQAKGSHLKPPFYSTRHSLKRSQKRWGPRKKVKQMQRKIIADSARLFQMLSKTPDNEQYQIHDDESFLLHHSSHPDGGVSMRNRDLLSFDSRPRAANLTQAQHQTVSSEAGKQYPSDLWKEWEKNGKRTWNRYFDLVDGRPVPRKRRDTQVIMLRRIQRKQRRRRLYEDTKLAQKRDFERREQRRYRRKQQQLQLLNEKRDEESQRVALVTDRNNTLAEQERVLIAEQMPEDIVLGQEEKDDDDDTVMEEKTDEIDSDQPEHFGDANLNRNHVARWKHTNGLSTKPTNSNGSDTTYYGGDDDYAVRVVQTERGVTTVTSCEDDERAFAEQLAKRRLKDKYCPPRRDRLHHEMRMTYPTLWEKPMEKTREEKDHNMYYLREKERKSMSTATGAFLQCHPDLNYADFLNENDKHFSQEMKHSYNLRIEQVVHDEQNARWAAQKPLFDCADINHYGDGTRFDDDEDEEMKNSDEFSELEKELYRREVRKIDSDEYDSTMSNIFMNHPFYNKNNPHYVNCLREMYGALTNDNGEIEMRIPMKMIEVNITDPVDRERYNILAAADTGASINCLGKDMKAYYKAKGKVSRAKKGIIVSTGNGKRRLKEYVSIRVHTPQRR